MPKSKIPRREESGIVRHARRELRLAGMFKKDEDYDGSIGTGSLAAVKTIDRYTRGDVEKLNAIMLTINEVVRGELLSPPSDDPNEWVPMKGSEPTIWQNKRSPFFRSKDNGVTWFHMKDENQELHPSMNHVTGEVPQDESIQENTDDGSDGGSIEKPTASDESNSASKSISGRGVDDGMATQGSEDPESPEIDTDQPTPRETA